ncbi:hypothetical protein RND81_12G012500 [Saponaria officinalis]|uniref:UBA domain-containing protein n=1 Tax=Saponaria officinalis TaxID=3572 RepID=A0AAW1H6B6_SAPOF
MNGSPSGFNNAPVTKAVVICSALFTTFFGFRGRSHKLGLSYQDVFQNPKIWKIIVSIYAFMSTPELMFGLFLLYYFRVFERQIGSNKYSVFILFSFAVSFFLESVVLGLLKDPSFSIASGPYSLVFSSFVPFFFDIPMSTRFRVFGLHFSDKSFIYLAGLQLLLSSWKRSIVPGICGVIAGFLYRLNIFYIRKAKLPDFISTLFSRLSWPSVGSSSSTAARTRNIPGTVSAPPYAGRQVERNYPSLIAGMVEPSEDSVAMLVSMGFDRDNARQALVQARNDVNVATNILLEAQSH